MIFQSSHIVLACVECLHGKLVKGIRFHEHKLWTYEFYLKIPGMYTDTCACGNQLIEPIYYEHILSWQTFYFKSWKS